MQICISQIDGVRYFSRFKNIPERDRLEVELTIEGPKPKVFSFDLTDVLLERFEEHPEILHRKRVIEGRYDMEPVRKKPAKTRTQRVAEPRPRPAAQETAPPVQERPARKQRTAKLIIETLPAEVPKKRKASKAKSALAPVAAPAAPKVEPVKKNGRVKVAAAPVSEPMPKAGPAAKIARPKQTVKTAATAPEKKNGRKKAVAEAEAPKPQKIAKVAAARTNAKAATSSPEPAVKPARAKKAVVAKLEGPKASARQKKPAPDSPAVDTKTSAVKTAGKDIQVSSKPAAGRKERATAPAAPKRRTKVAA